LKNRTCSQKNELAAGEKTVVKEERNGRADLAEEERRLHWSCPCKRRRRLKLLIKAQAGTALVDMVVD
jgi:hypothetical protein